MPHYYDRQGNSKYTIIGANGKERPTTLRDARKLDLVLGATDIIAQMDKPALIKWRLDNLLASVRKHQFKNKEYVFSSAQKIADRMYEDYKSYSAEEQDKRIWDEYAERTSSAAKAGNIIHDKLEQYYITGKLEPEDEDMLWPVIECVKEFNFDKVEAEKSFCSKDGYGGKIDLVGYKDDKVVIIDFKSKASEEPSIKDLWDDYFLQLAAYREAIKKQARCFNILISTTNHGKIYKHEWDKEKLDKGWKMFDLLLKFWQIKNDIEIH